ncbi:MAG: hypothetical protein FWG85_05345 [Bacteroidetes bacterium]|nr:hypothetical protein [Bacteroidota bacterium]
MPKTKLKVTANLSLIKSELRKDESFLRIYVFSLSINNSSTWTGPLLLEILKK